MNGKRRLLIGSFLCCLFISQIVSAQTDKVDEYIKGEMQKQGLPGLSIAVVKNGEVVLAKGYGYANVELKVAASPETIYQSGSVGKQFTAAAVMLLVEEGKIGLDDKISKYFDGAPDIWKDITVRHLLTHTSGIKNYTDDSFNYRLDYTEDDLVKKAASFSLDFQPGEKWSYSNTGYILLGVLIRKVSGKFYGDVLKERVFGPTGMTTARVITEEDIVPNRAAGYRMSKGVLKNQQYVSPSLNTTADGSLYLTVLDMAKWDAALYGEKLLKKSSFDQMWTPVKLNDGKTQNYGFGWAFGMIGNHHIIEHGGAWQGFTTHITRFVDDKFTVIVLTNISGANPGRIAHQVAGIYNPELKPIERKQAKVDPQTLDAYVGEYELGAGKILTVSRKGDKLLIAAGEQFKSELLAESETKFFIEELDAQISFVKDQQGKVTHLIFHQGGEVEAKKIK